LKFLGSQININLVIIWLLVFCLAVFAQETTKNESPSLCRIGEKITYNLSFNKFRDVGYAEIFCVSKGKLEEKDAIELRAKWRTSDLVSAAYYLFDESKTTFVSTETGFPLFTKRVINDSILPKEFIKNYLVNSSTNFDLLTAIYQARNLNGTGTIAFSEDEKIYSLTLQPIGSGKIKTDSGEFETTVVSLQSQYFTELGISDVRVNFSNDDKKIPVSFSVKLAKGTFIGTLASINIIEPIIEDDQTTNPIPVATPTPRPISTPRPITTPTPYLENQSLSNELPFSLGEQLTFKVTSQNQLIGNVVLQANARKLENRQDSLILSASVNTTNKILGLNDSVTSFVNPETLVPYKYEIKANGLLSKFNQTVIFDQTRGLANQAIQIPIGTHDILSLAYAIRSFNLKPSKVATNPVNDTRVSVIVGNNPLIFTIRPLGNETITFQKRKISAQIISITTGNMEIDRFNIRLWLSNDFKRLPLKFAFGTFQAELVSANQVSVK
jgi:hypothetical protein